MRKGHWKLIEYFEPRPDGTPHVELYDLASDPREADDLAAAEPERVQSMLAELRRWRAEVGAEVPTEPEPGYRRRDGDR